MKIKLLFIIAIVGILIGILSIFIYNEKIVTQPPVAASYNPFQSGVYASGIVESYQPTGSDTNIYPEVAGRVVRLFVKEGQSLKKGMPILAIDDSVQRQIVEKDIAQIRYEKASLVNVQQQLAKIEKSYAIDPQSVSKNSMDNAINAVKINEEAVSAAVAQFESDNALLKKYILRSPINGVVLRILPALGDYASPPTGSYDINTQGMNPTVQMGVITPYLQVRCYLDEILVPRLPSASNLQAMMFVRGVNNKQIPLTFVSIQPITIPNIQLSDEKQERVDVRVLPIVFRFIKPHDVNIYPGQLVDVYIKGK